jgi:hypothetical protein
MKRRLVGLFVLGLFSAVAIPVWTAAAGPEKPDFSGTWVIDFERSRLQTQAKIERVSFTVEHREPDFRFSRVFVVEGKEDRHAYALTADGKVKVEELADRTVHSRLYWAGETLVYDVRIVLKDGREATNVVRYSLRDGGRTFVAEEAFRGPILKYDNLWVAGRKG